jgi:hypothetical protein
MRTNINNVRVKEKEMNRTIAFVCFVLILGGCKHGSDVDFDRIQSTGRLPGIVEVRLNSDHSVTLVQGKGPYPIMLNQNKQSVQEATLQRGSQCVVSDGRHASWKYEFRSADSDRIFFKVKGRFDARSFGDGVTEKSRKVWVCAYSDYKGKPQPLAGVDAEDRVPHP